MEDDNRSIFSSRFAPEYFEHMTKRLRVAREEAVPPSSRDDCKSVVQIACIGVSGSTFFRPLLEYGDATRAASQAFLDAFARLIGSIPDLNREKISVSLRFLLAYPYSDYSMRLMMREKWQQKPVWDIFDDDGAEFEAPDFGAINGNHEEMFEYFQKETLAEFNKLRKRLRNNCVDTSYNQIELRFTPIPLNFRGIFINQWVYYDIYAYSKAEKSWPNVASQLPVVCVKDRSDISSDEEYYRTLSRDFEYIWDHAATLLLGDAVNRGQIRKPQDVDHRHKFRLIDSKTHSPRTRASVKHLSKHFFRNSVRIHDGDGQVAKVFIACSWIKNEKTGQSGPNEVAKELHDFITEVFSKREAGDAEAEEGYVAVRPEYVVAKVGEKIPEKIYEALNQASYAIVILTKDIASSPLIDGKRRKIHYTKPNVVHELGYLNHRIRRISKGDLLTLVENGAEYPTNEGAFVMYPFARRHARDRLDLLDTVMAWMAGSLCAFDQLAYERACQILVERGLVPAWPSERFPVELDVYLRGRNII